MALLDLANQTGVRCIAVHINYHKRDSADRDLRIVQDYCVKHAVPCVVFDAPEKEGNFQDFARRFRYEKFAEVVKSQNATGVLVAHHRNDDLETFVMQKQRNSAVTHYGLSDSTELFGIRVDRPLLEFTKQDLIEYCESQGITYGIDETNVSDDYLRNRIRKQLEDENLDALSAEKDKLNAALDDFRKSHQDLLQQNTLSMETFTELPYPLVFLQHWIRTQLPMKALSDEHLEELLRQIQSSPAFKHPLGNGRLIKQYGQISVLPLPQSYNIFLKAPSNLKTPFFEIKTEAQEIHGFDVIDSDFPLTIRNASSSEQIVIKGKVSKLSRWFISHKIPQAQRESWPVVVNASGEVIHIFRIRIPRVLNTYKSRLYMLK